MQVTRERGIRKQGNKPDPWYSRGTNSTFKNECGTLNMNLRHFI